MKCLIYICFAIVSAIFAFDSSANTEELKERTFVYFNDEWIQCTDLGMVNPDYIISIEMKNDEYGNRAIFITVPPEVLEYVKEETKKRTRDLFINYDPICEFPGGQQKFREWIKDNIQIPSSLKANTRVIVKVRIMPDGTATDQKILKASDNEDANKEAMRLASILPKFSVKYCTPKKAPINVTIPVVFNK